MKGLILFVGVINQPVLWVATGTWFAVGSTRTIKQRNTVSSVGLRITWGASDSSVYLSPLTNRGPPLFVQPWSTTVRWSCMKGLILFVGVINQTESTVTLFFIIHGTTAREVP